MFDVEWEESALDELSLIWMQGNTSERRAIREATNQIDAMLAYNPLEYGESREAGRRVLFEDPLVVYVSVDEENEVARVYRVLMPHRSD